MDANCVSRNNVLEKKCTVCKKVFYIPKCREWREKECSSECKNEKRNILKKSRERQCLICSKTFVPRLFQIKNDGGKYCSMECLHKTRIGAKDSEQTRKKRVESFKNSEYNKNRPKGRSHPQFKDFIIRDGYKWITNNNGRKVQEHRFVIEKIIGRKLRIDEVVHHGDRNRLNNDPNNLQIMTRAEHVKEHKEELTKSRS